MSSKQSSRQICPAFASSRLGRLFGSILVAATALMSSHSAAGFAASCNERGVTAETYNAIEADFYACVLNGLAQGVAIEPVEDECAIRLYAAIDANSLADESDSSQRAEVDADWWSEA